MFAVPSLGNFVVLNLDRLASGLQTGHGPRELQHPGYHCYPVVVEIRSRHPLTVGLGCGLISRLARKVMTTAA